MALVRKAGLERHLDLRHVLFQQLARSGDADGFQIPVGRNALLLGKRAQEMVLAQARDPAELVQRHGLRIPFLKVGAHRADAGFVLFGLGQRLPGVVAQELAQKQQEDFFLSELLVLPDDHGVQIAQGAGQLALGQDGVPELREHGLPGDFPHRRAHDVGQDADAPIAERLPVIGAAAVRLVRVEGEQIASGGDVLSSAAGQFPSPLLDEPDQVVVVEVVRERFQHVLEPVRLDGQFRIVVNASRFLQHDGSILHGAAVSSCMILRFG